MTRGKLLIGGQIDFSRAAFTHVVNTAEYCFASVHASVLGFDIHGSRSRRATPDGPRRLTPRLRSHAQCCSRVTPTPRRHAHGALPRRATTHTHDPDTPHPPHHDHHTKQDAHPSAQKDRHARHHHTHRTSTHTDSRPWFEITCPWPRPAQRRRTSRHLVKARRRPRARHAELPRRPRRSRRRSHKGGRRRRERIGSWVIRRGRGWCGAAC